MFTSIIVIIAYGLVLGYFTSLIDMVKADRVINHKPFMIIMWGIMLLPVLMLSSGASSIFILFIILNIACVAGYLSSESVLKIEAEV